MLLPNLAGTVAGFEVGARIIMLLEGMGYVDVVVRWLYVVLLTTIAWTVFADIAKRRTKEKAAATEGKTLDANASAGIECYKTLA